MKMISLWQPWASLMALGLKQYETRHWSTRYRGVIGIHATKNYTRNQKDYWKRLCADHPELNPYVDYEFPTGCVVAAMRLTHIFETEPLQPTLSLLEQHVGDYSPGRFAWKMELIKVPANPIPVVGQQGIWDWHPDKEQVT